mmetsp:Transcript_23155/g.78200  ORF Transcript_23155/g.78200 Transcript_23155/m.78200 type:complete len:236 (+) Transcript_23155:3240-3947(+)
MNLGLVQTQLGGMAVDGHVGEEAQVALDAEDLVLRTLVVGHGPCRVGDAEELRVLLDERSRDLARDEVRVLQHIQQERNVRFHPSDAHLQQRAAHPGDGALPGGRAGRVFYEEAVEKRRDRHPAVPDAVNTDAEALGVSVHGQDSRVRCKVPLRVLRRDPALHRDAPRADLVLRESQLVQGGPSGDFELRLDEINRGHFFSHGVLHLDARVHLYEIMPALFVHEELDGAGVFVLC